MFGRGPHTNKPHPLTLPVYCYCADIHIGREQGDDPTKFYLLDPYIITTGSPALKQGLTSSAVVSGGSGLVDVAGGGGAKGNAKRHAGVMKKVASSSALSAPESHIDGGNRLLHVFACSSECRHF